MAVLLLVIPAALTAKTLPNQPENDTTRLSVLLDEAFVTTTRTATLRRNLPSSVSIVAGHTLEQQQVRGIKELNASIPNLYMPDYGSALSTPIYIRGIGSRRSDRSAAVGVYYAGIPLMEQAAYDGDLGELASVEVLRGPQGTLYGRGGMGGVISLVPRSPLSHEGTSLTLYGGSYSQRGTHGALYRKVAERTGISAHMAYDYQRGFFTNAYNGKAIDHKHNLSSQIAIEHHTALNWHINAFAHYQYKDQGGYAYGHIDSLRKVTINYNTPSGYLRSLFTTGISIRKQWHQGIELRMATSYQSLKDRMTIDQDFTAIPSFEASQRTRKRVVTQETILSGHLTPSYHWLIGISGYYNNGSRNMHMDANTPRGTTHIYYGYNEPQWGGAVFHQSRLRLWPQLTLEVGTRLDWERITQRYTHLTTALGRTISNGTSDIGQNYLQLSPKASFIYTPSQSSRIYATISRGYNAGGFNTSFEQEDQRTYSPEYSWNYEIGIRWSSNNQRLTAEASTFYIDWRQQQVQRILPSNMGSFYNNAGRSRSIGAEGSVAYRPFDALTLTATYGFTRATFQQYTNGTSDYTGHYIPFVPRHTASLGAEYQTVLHHHIMQKIRLAAQYRALDKTFWNDANTLHQPFYGTLNAQVALETKYATLELWGKNILNSYYYAYQFIYAKQILGQRGTPAHWGVTLRFEFR